jgi:hypothetical protein
LVTSCWVFSGDAHIHRTATGGSSSPPSRSSCSGSSSLLSSSPYGYERLDDDDLTTQTP